MAEPPQQRGVPESRPGAEPGDERAPEHSHGVPIDDPQPSAPWRDDVPGKQETTDDDVD